MGELADKLRYAMQDGIFHGAFAASVECPVLSSKSMAGQRGHDGVLCKK